MTHTAIAALTRKAALGTLEVEDLLRVASKPAADVADALDALATEQGWPAHPCFPAVPLATWAAVVSVYCRAGHDGLFEIAREPDMLPFVLGILEALKTDEALATVVRIAGSDAIAGRADARQTGAIVSALNLAAMNSRPGGPTESDRVAGRNFLHAASARAGNADQWASLVCALRFFGDETSLDVISACPPLPPHWEPARKAAVRAIKRAARRPG
jgi:hypothetical protein